tara:strand:- start:5230 stop:5616 length:387 start_codon:yes stop_codon:yes gene_type:complete
MSVTRESFKSLASSFVNSVFADFTKSIVIQSLIRASDGQGGYTTTWTDFASTRCFVTKSAGGEVVEKTGDATKIDQDDVFLFEFEFIDNITDEMRIVYDGDNYNIKSGTAVQEVDIWLKLEAELTEDV